MMHTPAEFAFNAAHRLLLGCASLLVARERRSDWLCEWQGELWHVRHATVTTERFSLRNEYACVKFCLGAYPDAWCLRRMSATPAFTVHRSAIECLAWMVLLVGVLAVIAHSLSGVTAETDTMHYRVRPGLLLIQEAGATGKAIPAVSRQVFDTWQSTRQRNFDALAYYRSTREEVALVDGRPLQLQVAHASANLLSLLDVPVLLTSRRATDAPEAVLSHKAWMRDFDGDPNIAGRRLRVGHQMIRIAGVAPSSSLSLPTDPDLWLLGATGPAADESTERGFVVAHLSVRGQEAFDLYGNYLPIAAAGDDPDQPSLVGVALYDQSTGISRIARFALLLALLALPAVVSVSLNESTFSAYRPSWKRQCVRGLFLTSKLVLVSAIAYYASVVLAYGFLEWYTPSAEFAQFMAGFVLSLLGLRWALLDQCHRCPVCLRHVAHPARVGLFSQTFLGWNGTEMFCAGGHTLLHVPALPTSWFHSPRWIYLDPSWQSLFTA